MITLNTKDKLNKSKMRVGRGIGSGKGKTSGRGVKGQNHDQVLLLRVLKVVKCRYIEDFRKEDLIQYQEKILQ